MNSTKVRIVTAVGFIVLAVGIFVSGDEFRLNWIRFFGAAVIIANLVLTAWEKYVWRWSILQKLPSVTVNLSGTWKGELVSFWKSPDGSSPPSKDVFLVIQQTSSTVMVLLMTDESKSWSSVAAIEDASGIRQLKYMYRNTPALQHEDRSRAHQGAASLDVSGLPAKVLKGRYWTDRESSGELYFSERDSRVVDSFDSARSLFDLV